MDGMLPTFILEKKNFNTTREIFSVEVVCTGHAGQLRNVGFKQLSVKCRSYLNRVRVE